MTADEPDPLTVKCPRCQSAPGASCVSGTGRRVGTHRLRRDAAAVAAARASCACGPCTRDREAAARTSSLSPEARARAAELAAAAPPPLSAERKARLRAIIRSAVAATRDEDERVRQGCAALAAARKAVSRR